MKADQIYMAARKRFITLFRGRYFVATRRSGIFLIDIRDHVSRQIEAYGLYETRQISLFSKRTREFQCTKFLDVGANLGLYCIFFANNSDLDIFAFEPDKRIRHQLCANLFLNDLDDRIEVVPIALSDNNGVAQFERFSDQNRGRSRIAETGLNLVQTATLDSFLHWSGEKVAIKVDIEGHERAFLDGARKFLVRNKCMIQMEINDCFDTTRKVLNELGYSYLDGIGFDHYFAN